MRPLEAEVGSEEWEETQVPQEVLGSAHFVENDETVNLEEKRKWDLFLWWEEEANDDEDEGLREESDDFEQEAFIRMVQIQEVKVDGKVVLGILPYQMVKVSFLQELHSVDLVKEDRGQAKSNGGAQKEEESIVGEAEEGFPIRFLPVWRFDGSQVERKGEWEGVGLKVEGEAVDESGNRRGGVLEEEDGGQDEGEDDGLWASAGGDDDGERVVEPEETPAEGNSGGVLALENEDDKVGGQEVKEDKYNFPVGVVEGGIWGKHPGKERRVSVGLTGIGRGTIHDVLSSIRVHGVINVCIFDDAHGILVIPIHEHYQPHCQPTQKVTSDWIRPTHGSLHV